ncbi:MAG: SpoIIE family protein phosphatase [Bacteroidia bacterium]|nr:SpoIIE family protein phosphatase [Bacteroidia bacterium]
MVFNVSFLNCQDTSATIVAVADCTGHGIPGAFMSMLGIAFLNDIVIKNNITSPDAVLNNMRENIIKALHQTGNEEEAKDGIVMSICSIEKEKKLLKFAGANNSLYLITPVPQGHCNKVSSAGAGNNADSGDLAGQALLKEIKGDVSAETNMKNCEKQLIEVKADKMPISISNNMKPFTLHELTYSDSDTFYMFSDGYADQFGGENGEKIKLQGLKKILCSISQKPMFEQREILNNKFEQWKSFINPETDQSYEQVDDVLIVGFKI